MSKLWPLDLRSAAASSIPPEFSEYRNCSCLIRLPMESPSNPLDEEADRSIPPYSAGMVVVVSTMEDGSSSSSCMTREGRVIVLDLGLDCLLRGRTGFLTFPFPNPLKFPIMFGECRVAAKAAATVLGLAELSAGVFGDRNMWSDEDLLFFPLPPLLVPLLPLLPPLPLPDGSDMPAAAAAAAACASGWNHVEYLELECESVSPAAKLAMSLGNTGRLTPDC